MEWIDDALASLERQTRLRKLLPVVPKSPIEVMVDGQETVLFSSNDYLGLSQHPEVRQAAADVALDRGMGNRGAALICGYSDHHEALEEALAELKATDAALLFPTGYQANVGLLSALSSTETVFFSDRLNHASIIDGCRLARCPVKIYDHLNVQHLDELLAADSSRRKVVITDALFSMDGDLAPLSEIAELKVKYEFTWVLDEAHATLIYGDNGGGLATSLGLSDVVDFQVGTLSKAIGAHGGFVATSHKNKQWLLNTARAFIFTTSLPAPVVAAASKAIEVSQKQPGLRQDLWARIRQLSNGISRPLNSPIAPIILGDEASALALSREFLEAGFHVTAIRPPTVPRGTSRLRVALCAVHTEAHVNDLISMLKPLNLSYCP